LKERRKKKRAKIERCSRAESMQVKNEMKDKLRNDPEGGSKKSGDRITFVFHVSKTTDCQ
jgi:hypothetical protein